MSVSVRIVTPRRIAFDATADEVQAPSLLGEMGVLEGHESLLALGRPGRLIVKGHGGDTSFVIGTGFVEVGPEHLTVLTDHCEEAGTVSPEEARQALEEAEAILATSTEGTPAWDDAERQADLARARLG